MAATGPASVAGVSPASEKYTLEQGVVTIKDNLPIALAYEDLKSSSFAQLAERTSSKLDRGACLMSIFVTPIALAVVMIVSLGRFLTGYAFWSSKGDFKLRFSDWGRALYLGIAGIPLLTVITEIAYFAGVIEPRLLSKFEPLRQAFMLRSKQKLISEAAHNLLRGGKENIGVAVGVLQAVARDKRVVHRIEAMIKSDATITIDAIVREIFTPVPDRREVAPSDRDEA